VQEKRFSAELKKYSRSEKQKTHEEAKRAIVSLKAEK